MGTWSPEHQDGVCWVLGRRLARTCRSWYAYSTPPGVLYIILSTGGVECIYGSIWRNMISIAVLHGDGPPYSIIICLLTPNYAAFMAYYEFVVVLVQVYEFKLVYNVGGQALS